METSTNVLQTVVRLYPKLQGIARRVADTAAGYEPEDVYQDMTLALVEREKQEPTFLEQKDAYILSHCSWNGRHKAAAGRVYGKYNEPENLKYELVSDKAAGPEDEAETRELLAGLKNVIEGLSLKDKKILSLLMIDYSPADIARRLNVSRSAICQRLQRIRKTLASAICA